jgi:hypothetical protein
MEVVKMENSILFLERARLTTDWAEYHSCINKVYDELFASTLLQKGNALATLHHSSVPDRSAVAALGMRWSVYSAPSKETLLALTGALTKYTITVHAARTHRYILAVTDGEAPCRAEVLDTVDVPFRKHFDFATMSVPESLSIPPESRPLLGAALLVGETDSSVVTEWCRKSPPSSGAQWIAAAEAMSISSGSIVDQRVARAILSSFAIFGLATAGLHDEIVERYSAEPVSIWLAAQQGEGLHSLASTRKLIQDIAKKVPIPCFEVVVRPRDTLSEIVVRELGLYYAEILPLLRSLNPDVLKNPDVIHPGWTLRLPHFPRR